MMEQRVVLAGAGAILLAAPLAAALLTDQPAFRLLQPDDPLIVHLRETHADNST